MGTRALSPLENGGPVRCYKPQRSIFVTNYLFPSYTSALFPMTYLPDNLHRAR
jgi:hypothetical protein